MNSWRKSLLIGMATAVLAYFNAGFFIDAGKKRHRYPDMAYSVKISSASGTAGRGLSNKTVAILNERLDQFGVDFSHDDPTFLDNGDLLVRYSIREVADTSIVRDMLESTGNLQFTEMYTADELATFMQTLMEEIDKVHPVVVSTPPATEATNGHQQVTAEIKELLDSVEGYEKVEAREKLADQAFLQASYYPSSIGTVAVTDTAALSGIFMSDVVRRALPVNAVLAFGTVQKQFIGKKELKPRIAVHVLKLRDWNNPLLHNDHVLEAKAGTGTSGKPEVTFQFNEEGSFIWEKLTAANINRPVAIVVNGRVLSAPMPSGAIKGGSSVVQGDFTVPEARMLAVFFGGSPLPARSVVVEAKKVQLPGRMRKKLAIVAITFLFTTMVSAWLFNTLKST